MSSYDRWKTDPPEVERIEEYECGECGEHLDDAALERLNAALSSNETDEDDESVLGSAMCSKCEEGDE